MEKNNNKYYQIARTDIAELVPMECKKILEVGCGYGSLGGILKSRVGVEIDGIEINGDAAPFLAKNYRKFWINSVEDLSLPEYIGHYDCIIFPDVLEHLVDPWKTLTKYTQYLSTNGVIIASIPNIRNLGIIYRLLLQGRWAYGESGILDKTHLRFFTRNEIESLFTDAGLQIEEIKTNRDRYSLLRQALTLIPRMLIPDLGVCQFLIRAKK
ncbi:class I SAM-dependent methyltransferase [Polynucleobacter paneuropaeus]|nr:class I SAM-dependent methyltransferase [Polynucleobacter paneuropaeus]